MKGVALVLVLTAELVFCNKEWLTPHHFYKNARDVEAAYILGRKYEVLSSMVVTGDLDGQEDDTPNNFPRLSVTSLKKMRISAYGQIHSMLHASETQAQDFGLKQGVGREGETNKVVAFWDGVCHETQFTIDTLKQFKSPDTEPLKAKLSDIITLAKQRRVEASKQFVAALLFGNYDEQPEIWLSKFEARYKLGEQVDAQDAKDTESIKLGFIALIKEHRLAKELVSKMSLEKLREFSARQLLSTYAFLCKEQEKSDSALTIAKAPPSSSSGSAEAPSISSSDWAGIQDLLNRRGKATLYQDVQEVSSMFLTSDREKVKRMLKKHEDDSRGQVIRTMFIKAIRKSLHTLRPATSDEEAVLGSGDNLALYDLYKTLELEHAKVDDEDGQDLLQICLASRRKTIIHMLEKTKDKLEIQLPLRKAFVGAVKKFLETLRSATSEEQAALDSGDILALYDLYKTLEPLYAKVINEQSLKQLMDIVFVDGDGKRLRSAEVAERMLKSAKEDQPDIYAAFATGFIGLIREAALKAKAEELAGRTTRAAGRTTRAAGLPELSKLCKYKVAIEMKDAGLTLMNAHELYQHYRQIVEPGSPTINRRSNPNATVSPQRSSKRSSSHHSSKSNASP